MPGDCLAARAEPGPSEVLLRLTVLPRIRWRRVNVQDHHQSRSPCWLTCCPLPSEPLGTACRSSQGFSLGPFLLIIAIK